MAGAGWGVKHQPLTCLKSASVNADRGHLCPCELASCAASDRRAHRSTSFEIVPYFAFTYHFGVAGIDGSWNDSVATYASRNRDTPAGGSDNQEFDWVRRRPPAT